MGAAEPLDACYYYPSGRVVVERNFPLKVGLRVFCPTKLFSDINLLLLRPILMIFLSPIVDDDVKFVDLYGEGAN